MNRSILDEKSDFPLADIRKRYTRDGLTEESLPDDPFLLFRQWLDEALKSDVPEPNAMNLSTISPEGDPNGRMVLLKGIEDGAVHFYTNYTSQKGQDLKTHPIAACTFWWAELERQVRISGQTEKLPEEVSEKYFESRPRESQIGAWASEQSSLVQDRSDLENRFKEAEKRFLNKPVPKPGFWGGYKIEVHSIEFWQGRPGRMHDRIQYQKVDDEWFQNRLAP